MNSKYLPKLAGLLMIATLIGAFSSIAEAINKNEISGANIATISRINEINEIQARIIIGIADQKAIGKIIGAIDINRIPVAA